MTLFKINNFSPSATDRIDKELLAKHHEGLIAIIPSFAGDVAIALRSGD